MKFDRPVRDSQEEWCGRYITTHHTHPCRPVLPWLQVLRTLVLCSLMSTPEGGTVHVTVALRKARVMANRHASWTDLRQANVITQRQVRSPLYNPL